MPRCCAPIRARRSRLPCDERSRGALARRGSEFHAARWTMLGDLIANLDRPDVTAAVLATMDPIVAARFEQRSAAVSMVAADFAAGAVRDFVDRADDEHWALLVTIMPPSPDPRLPPTPPILHTLPPT